MRKKELLDNDQRDAIAFIRDGDDSLVAADVGTGKTVITLTATHADRRRWLVLAPLLVATDTWPKEPQQWHHLSHIRMSVACGSEKERIAAIEADTQYVTMNYENLTWLMERYPKGELPFTGLICDEIDKLKSVSSDRFKKFRHRINEFDRRIGLTGTLIPNDLTELWGQVYIVDGGESFGRSFYEWRKKYFYPIDFKQYDWKPFEKTEQQLVDRIADISYVLRGKGLPEVIMERPEKLIMPPALTKLYKELEKEYYLMLEDKHGTKHEIDVDSAGVLAGKLQQLTAGFSYVGDKKNRETVWHSRDKFDWVEQTLQNLGDEQALIFYHFNEELEELKRVIPDLRHIGKGTTNKQALSYINEWNADKLSELALHPASAGHGLNLQLSGCQHIIFTTMPWSGGLLKQSIGRLARRGQLHNKVHVHSAVFKDSIDLDVHAGLTGKSATMKSFLDLLESAGKTN